MQKKMLLILLAACLGLSSLAADGMTWVNPWDSENWMYPGSMLSAVSNGIWYDELDTVIRSPMELGNYEGYTLYTAYGNYESWVGYPLGGGPGPEFTLVNPFSTTNMSYTSNLTLTPFTPINFMTGLIFPLMDFRTGIVTGFVSNLANNQNLDGVAGTEATATGSDTTVVDLATVGTADYTIKSSYDYTDYTVQRDVRAGTGIDLGFMGASLFLDMETNTIKLGGIQEYTYTAGTDTAYVEPANLVTTRSYQYGVGEEGAVTSYPGSGTVWVTGINGQLPLEVAGIGLPVFAGLRFGSNGKLTSAYGVPERYSVTEKNVTAVPNDDTSVLTVITGDGTVDLQLDAFQAAGEISADPNGYGLAFTSADDLSGSAALDSANIDFSDFTIGLTSRTDPTFDLNDNAGVATRLGVSYDLETSHSTDAGMYSVNYSIADGTTVGSGGNGTYSQSYAVSSPQRMTQNDIGLEIGGILELKNSTGNLSVATGLFYTPTFTFATTTYGTETETWTTTYDDGNAATTAVPTATGDVVGIGNLEGAKTVTNTTTYTGADKTTTIVNNFSLPVSVKISLVKDKLDLVGGYILSHSTTTTSTTETADSTSDTVTSVYNTPAVSGTPVATTQPTPAPVDSSTQTATSSSKTDSTGWNGQMNFMLRWLPAEGLTVDFIGSSIMTALNFGILGGTTAGFNPNTFISSLGISVTYSIK